MSFAIGVGNIYLSATALHDLQLGVSDLDRVAGLDRLEPVEPVPELRDVWEEVPLDDLLDRRHIAVLVEDLVVLAPKVSGGARIGIWIALGGIIGNYGWRRG